MPRLSATNLPNPPAMTETACPTTRLPPQPPRCSASIQSGKNTLRLKRIRDTTMAASISNNASQGTIQPSTIILAPVTEHLNRIKPLSTPFPPSYSALTTSSHHVQQQIRVVINTLVGPIKENHLHGVIVVIATSTTN